MIADPTCPSCGSALDPEALEGLCSKCLARGLVESAAGTEDKPWTGPAGPQVIEGPGTVIGRYKLLQCLGEGGFGVVFMAEQREPIVRRVALKVLKQGMDTRQVIARFEAERQALALMDHPAIAKVFDAGATDTGRPYFVMELVRGMPITRFCDEHDLDLRQRLELFAEVCSAVQHAHQKGIIHRDLKPSNILVGLEGDRPVPKVIDFGIAKATQQLLTDKTLFTRFDQFIGTPQYVSPEQVGMNAMDVDTRSDIYSLGVVLYELLTGNPPLDAREIVASGFDEMRRIIREKEPPKPSTRLSTLGGEDLETVAKHRGVEPGKLGSLLKGDLDWIVLKAIEKDRTRRYETANSLALDIRRHLHDEPVSAMPPSAAYKFGKFARRHKGRLAAATAFALAVATGAVISTWQALRANRALSELRDTAPAFVSEARVMVASERFDDAIARVGLAIKLKPEEPDFHLYKADLLQSQLRLAEAAVTYREVLKLRPNDARATANLRLSEELLAAGVDSSGNWPSESLARLQSAMHLEKRPATEILPISRLLGREADMYREVWLERLRDLQIGPGKPLEARLGTTPGGQLTLDLSESLVSELSLLKGMPLEVLNLGYCPAVTDIEPLRDMPLQMLEMPYLVALDDTDAKVLGSLRELKILDLTAMNISDLSPLRGLALEGLNLSFTHALSLDPLRGMPLETVVLDSTPARDFGALAGAPIEQLLIGSPHLGDLGFLKGMPLRDLIIDKCPNARNLAVIATLEQLACLALPRNASALPEAEQAAIDRLEGHPSLRQIDDGEMALGEMVRSIGTKEEFWSRWKPVRSLRTRLIAAGLDFSLSSRFEHPDRGVDLTIKSPAFEDLSILKGSPVTHLEVSGTSVSDLSDLEGLPLMAIVLSRTHVSDLSPLRAAPLEQVYVSHTHVESLEPLRGLKLQILHAAGTPVSELSPLSGMPLWDLRIAGTKVLDLTPLLQSPLRSLQLNESARNVEILARIETLTDLAIPSNAPYLDDLRKLRNILRISYGDLAFEPDGRFRAAMTAEEFWEVDGPTEAVLVTLTKSATRNPSDALLSLHVAALQVWLGRDFEHEAFARRGLAWVETSNNADDLERIAKLAALRPMEEAPIREAALRVARRAMELGVKDQSTSGFPWYSMTVGMAEYRSGNDSQAILALSAAEEAALGLAEKDFRAQIRGTSAFYRVMSLLRQGDDAAAQALFAATEAEMKPYPVDPKSLAASVGHNDLVLWLAYREAKALLGAAGLREN